MIYLDNNTFQQEIFIPRSSVKNDASPEYATKNELENAIENEVIRADEKYAAKTDLLPYATTGWVESQDFATKEWTDGQIQSAIASETGRTEETYQKKSEMGIYSTTNEVGNMIDGAVSGKMDTSAMSAYTPTSGFATINGSAITEGGNIVIEGGGSDYSAGSNINIDENNVISVTGITVPTSNTAFTNDAGYVTSGEVESQITGKNYATENWVQDNVNLAIESETARTESTYAKIGDIPSLDGYATTGWVESQGYLKEHQDISGKLDTSVFTAYTANTQTELNNKQDASAMTAYYTSAQTDTAIQNATNGLASEEWVESQRYLTGYTETDPVFMASAASGITSQDITNWNAKLDSSALNPYYTSAQTDNAISNAVSGKADSSAVTAQISEVKAQIEAEIPTKVSSLENDLNFVNSADVKTQIEGYNYINSGQAQTQIDNSISGKLNTDIFTTYTANTKTEIDNKQDASGMTAYATTAFTENTYAKIGDIPTKTSDLTNDSGFITDAALSGYATEQYVDNSVSGKVDNSALTQYYTSAQTDTAIQNATNGLASEEWVNNQGFLKEHQDISGKLDTSVFTAYTANTQTELNNKQDASAMTAYATTAFTESTYLKEHQSLSAYTPTSGFSTINGSAITEGGNLVIEETSYTAGANIDISTDNVISVTGITIPTKLSELTNDSGYINSGQAQTQIDSSVSGKVDTDVFTAYTANTKTEIDNAVSGKVDSSRVDEIEEVTASALVELHNTKQDILVSGTNIKTINNESILGSGNIVIQGGSGGGSYTAGANIDITDNVISVTGITIPTSNTAFTNDAGYVNSGEVETQITSKGYITGFTESDPVFQASAASGITSQDITNWNNKLDSSALTPYYTSAQTDTAISNATTVKQDTLVSGVNIKTINNQSLLGSGNIEIQGSSGGGSNIIELTQAEYDALTSYTKDAMYVITDAQEINMDNYVTTGDMQTTLDSYYTSAETDTAISNAVSGKTDKVSVDSNDFECIFPTWNNQGCITGTYATAYQVFHNINDSDRRIFSDSFEEFPTIYAPTSAGSAGQPLLSNGSGAPVWGSYKFQFISQSQYNALATKDSTTIYFIVNEN